MPVTTAPPSGRAGPARRPPLDPRMRERLIAVRRAEGRRRLRWLFLVLGIAGLGAATFAITHSPLLAVHHVKVSGAVHTDRQDVVAAAGLASRPLMIDVRSSISARQLGRLPWVDHAAVIRRWPDTVEIRLTERVPVARVNDQAGGGAWLDRTGRVLVVGVAAGVAGPSPAQWLPTIAGVEAAGPAGSTLAGGPPVVDALNLVLALQRGMPPALAPRVAGVVVTPDGQLVVTARPSVTVRFGTADQLDAKVLALRTMIERVDLSGLVTLDVRVPDAPVLTRPARTTTVSTTPRG